MSKKAALCCVLVAVVLTPMICMVGSWYFSVGHFQAANTEELQRQAEISAVLDSAIASQNELHKQVDILIEHHKETERLLDALRGSK